ncbi:MAG TPA: type VI secretion system protein TssA [Thermoanaerobaculia bacterium]
MKVDLERLLTPISGARPSGEPVRYSGVYDQVQEARREDDPALPQGVWKTDLKKADWPEVERLCLDALETRSKDLQLAVWLLEAWLRMDGAAGVAQGLRLLGGLSESFWETLHPGLEDGDPEARLAPLFWLEEKLSETLKRYIPVTRPETEGSPSYSLMDWESARYLENVARSNPQVLEAAETNGKITTAKFLASVSLTPGAFYAALLHDLRESLDALGELGALLESRCGDRAPGFHRFAGNLMAVQQMTARVLEEKPAEPGAPPRDDAAEEEPMTGGWYEEPEEETFHASGPIRSRAEAYRRLSEAADYLLRTEPHSPAPYLVRRAVAWGSMSLSELLHELLQGGGDLRTLYHLLGIKGDGA